MDVVYVVRTGSNDELRYSLRSLRNLAHDKVWIVGHAEPWLRNYGYLATRQDGVSRRNAWQNLSAAASHRHISDPFVLMNDDFFVTAPVEDLIPQHRGSLLGHAAEGNGDRHSGLARTATLLRGLGVAEPLSYETHTPMVVAREGFAAAVEMCASDPHLAPKSIYANLAGLGGINGGDAKVHDTSEEIPAGPFLSTSDRSWARHPVGRLIRDMFPDPSPYEVTS